MPDIVNVHFSDPDLAARIRRMLSGRPPMYTPLPLSGEGGNPVLHFL